MNTTRILVLVIPTLLAFAVPLRASDSEIRLIDGRKFAAETILLPDAWTLTVRHADGTATFSTALLTAEDLAKVAPSAKLDGRYWYERAMLAVSLKNAAIADECRPHAREILAYQETLREAAAKHNAALREDAAKKRQAKAQREFLNYLMTDPDAYSLWIKEMRRQRALDGR